MENNKFFAWVWRLNGIIILLVAGLLACFLIYELTKNIFRSRPEKNVIVNVAEDPKGEERWALGSPTHILGNDFLLLPLVSENKKVKEVKRNSLNFSGSGRYARSINYPAKNILFLNAKSNESFWLFKNTGRLILATEQFPYSYGTNSENEKTKAIFYEVVSSDTNNDDLLTYEDKLSLAMSKPDGRGYQVLLKEYDRIISKSLVDNGNILIIYQINGVGISKLIKISPFEVISSKELPHIKNS